MEAKAIAKFVRISPRKVGVVLDLIRGKDAKYAEAVLKQLTREHLTSALSSRKKKTKGRFKYGSES